MILPQKIKTFTLLELVVVLVIIGILSTVAVSHFGIMHEKILAREAISQLKIIQSAENVYRLENETGNFIGCVDTLDCNAKLGIALPAKDWEYLVRDADDTEFTAAAQRLWGSRTNCEYTIQSTDSITSNNGNCVYNEQ
jgi:prepilin-type N-terminal cleavage/methylation domain-containing protein